MANSENLKPVKKGDLTKEEAKRRGSNGGKKSGEISCNSRHTGWKTGR